MITFGPSASSILVSEYATVELYDTTPLWFKINPHDKSISIFELTMTGPTKKYDSTEITDKIREHILLIHRFQISTFIFFHDVCEPGTFTINKDEVGETGLFIQSMEWQQINIMDAMQDLDEKYNIFDIVTLYFDRNKDNVSLVCSNLTNGIELFKLPIITHNKDSSRFLQPTYMENQIKTHIANIQKCLTSLISNYPIYELISKIRSNCYRVYGNGENLSHVKFGGPVSVNTKTTFSQFKNMDIDLFYKTYHGLLESNINDIVELINTEIGHLNSYILEYVPFKSVINGCRYNIEYNQYMRSYVHKFMFLTKTFVLSFENNQLVIPDGDTYLFKEPLIIVLSIFRSLVKNDLPNRLTEYKLKNI
jgi:hypothetical protein